MCWGLICGCFGVVVVGVCFWGVAWVVSGVRCGLLGGLFGFCFCRVESVVRS
jgi:hypothetical protein